MTDKVTIAEASRITGKNETSLYRHIRKGKLLSEKVTVNDRQVTVITKAELERVFNIKCQATDKQEDRQLPDIKTIVKEAIQEQQAVIMKPIEEQALFIAGTLTKENEFLRQKVETLLQELEKFKALPVDLDTRNKEIQGLNEELKALAEKNREQEERLKRKWWKWWK